MRVILLSITGLKVFIQRYTKLDYLDIMEVTLSPSEDMYVDEVRKDRKVNLDDDGIIIHRYLI